MAQYTNYLANIGLRVRIFDLFGLGVRGITFILEIIILFGQ